MLQKQAQVDVQNERTMIGLVAIENSLPKQVEGITVLSFQVDGCPNVVPKI
jgi:hypothetical protein